MCGISNSTPNLSLRLLQGTPGYSVKFSVKLYDNRHFLQNDLETKFSAKLTKRRDNEMETGFKTQPGPCAGLQLEKSQHA